jgi:NhaP-type Na+/H+ or K+/H+ antiporter
MKAALVPNFFASGEIHAHQLSCAHISSCSSNGGSFDLRLSNWCGFRECHRARLFTAVAVAWLAHYFMDLPLAAGCVPGAIISPPDAIAATAIAERLKVPRRIVTILEGESLVNNAAALVAYRFAVAALVTGSFSLAHASGRFFAVGIGGILTGLTVGWLVEQFHKRVDDAPIEITVSLLTPFVAYLSAERLELSGVLAVVTGVPVTGLLKTVQVIDERRCGVSVIQPAWDDWRWD